nr:hypothetical protein [Saccharomycopsis selenospora]
MSKYLFFTSENISGNFECLFTNYVNYLRNNDLHMYNRYYFTGGINNINILDRFLPFSVSFKFPKDKLNDIEYINNYIPSKFISSKISIVFNLDGIHSFNIPNNFLIVNSVNKLCVKEYLYSSRESSFEIEEFFVIIHNKLYLGNILYGLDFFKEVSSFDVNNIDLVKLDIFIKRTLVYSIKPISLDINKFFVVLVKNEKDMILDFYDRIKTALNKDFLLYDGTVRRIPDVKNLEFIYIFVFNNERLNSEHDYLFKYIDVKDEYDIKSYLFFNNIGFYFIWKNFQCSGNIILFNSNFVFNVPFTDLDFCSYEIYKGENIVLIINEYILKLKKIKFIP